MKITKEAKIGFSTIVTIALLIWGFNFLKGKNILKSTNVFYLVYGKLGGLKESNNVLINGFKVGQVTELKLKSDKSRRVEVKILVDKKYKIPKGSMARLSSVDFMGTKAIELILTDSHEFHKNGDTIKSKIGEGIMDKVEDFEEKIMQITLSMDSLLFSLNNLFDENMQYNIKGTVRNLRHVTGNIEKMTDDDGNLNILINQLKITSKKLSKAFETLPETMSNIKTVTDSLKASEIKMLINNTTQTLDNLNKVLSKIERGEGSAGQLVNNDSLYINLTNTTKELELLLKDLRENPKRYVHISVFGKKDKK